ncbi:sensor histidine kinase [Lignipirellula cremea]|nr:ATP-binding protein [Lignipirellula cremea]
MLSLLALTILVLGIFAIRANREGHEQVASNRVAQVLDQQTQLFANLLNQLKTDVIQPVSWPEVARLTADSQGNKEAALAHPDRQKIEVRFRQLLSGKPNYVQARLISREGWEIVRVDRPHAGAPLNLESPLSNKQNAPYFRDLLARYQSLSHRDIVDQVVFTRLAVNREGADRHISEPRIAVARACAPLSTVNYEFTGIVVINVDVTPFLEDCKHSGVIVLNQDDVVIARQGEPVLAFEELNASVGPEETEEMRYTEICTHGKYCLQDIPLRPDLIAWIGKNRDAFRQELDADTAPSSEREVKTTMLDNKFAALRWTPLGSNSLALTNDDRPRLIGFLQLADKHSLQLAAYPFERTLWATGAVLFAIGCLLSLLLTRMITRPLSKITRAALQFADNGAYSNSPPVNARDEIGQLASAFLTMAERVASREARIRAIVATAAEGIVTVDDDNRILSANLAAEAIFETSNLVHRQLSEFISLRHESFSSDPASGATAAGHDGVRRLEVKGKRHGKPFPLEIASSSFVASGRRLRTYVVRDISEAKATREALEQLNRELEQRVADRVAELQRTVQELDNFAYAASHDLKAPLRGIHALANWIEEDASEALPERSRKHLQTLLQRIGRMERLLDDLLTYSRVGRVNGSATRVPVRKLLDDVIDLQSPPPGFVFDLPETMPVLLTEQAPLEQVFRNLISNAIKHHNRKDGRITIRCTDLGSAHEFHFQDDGPGIAPRFHEKIFQMFETLRPRDEVEGSGMGLALIRKIVENAGGQIRVESDLGAGTTFLFTWPKTEAQTPRPSSTSSSSSS